MVFVLSRKKSWQFKYFYKIIQNTIIYNEYGWILNRNNIISNFDDEHL